MSLYVALDGPDGCGKSSQAQALVAWLESSGHTVQHVREPGSTPTGEALRQLLLAPSTGEIETVTEALLFSAARAELVAKVIEPARQRGEVVVAERCYLSTIVYQSLASTPGLDLEWLFDLTRRVHRAWLPDLVVVLDVPPELAQRRRRARSVDRIEARDSDYHARVRDGFLAAARLEPRARIVDAAHGTDEVQAALRVLVHGCLA